MNPTLVHLNEHGKIHPAGPKDLG